MRPRKGGPHQDGLAAMVTKLGPSPEEQFANLRALQAVHQRALEALAVQGDALINAAYNQPGATLASVAARFGIHASRVGAMILRHTERESEDGQGSESATTREDQRPNPVG